MATTKILFLFLPYSNLFHISAASEVFLKAKELGLDLDLEYCAFERNIDTSLGIPLNELEDCLDKKLEPGDYLFIGSTNINYILLLKENVKSQFYKWVRNIYKNGVNICSICNGTFILANSGILDGRNCTIHWNYTTIFKDMYPKINVLENILFVEDGRIYTSAGASACIDIALHIVDKLKGENFSYKISKELVVYNRRAGNYTQQSVFLNYRSHMHSGVHKVQDWLQENLDKKTSLNSLAEIAHMSSRNLTRVFKKECNLTINEYISLLRIEKIKELKKNPDITRKQIAKLCGFQNERQIMRLQRQ